MIWLSVDRLKAEVEIHAVSCPGVFFPCKGPVSSKFLFTLIEV